MENFKKIKNKGGQMEDLKPVDFRNFVEDIQAKTELKLKTKMYRFDIFKGEINAEGKIVKKKSVGNAYLREGFRTYTVHIKTLLNNVFYILPNNHRGEKCDFVILTREPALQPGRKFFWNNVGEGWVLDGPNKGMIRLTWDFFANGLYMNVFPTSVSNSEESSKAAA
jgi:hypothetical protein